MRALGYYRIDEGDASRDSFEEAFREYCDVNLHQPVQTFGDDTDDDSATAYARMLAYMRDTGRRFLIVVPGARHLGLDLEAVARAVVELEATGAKVTCDDDHYPDPLQNAFHTNAWR